MIKNKVVFLIMLATLGLYSCMPTPKKLSYLEECEQFVLRQDKIGQEFVFKPDASKVPEYRFTYMGSIDTKKGSVVKVLSLGILFGLLEDSKRGNGVVILFNGDNDFIGSYVLGDLGALPTSLSDKELVFAYNNEDCNQETAINLYDSIPNEIFVGCSIKNGEVYGDVYSLEFSNSLLGE